MDAAKVSSCERAGEIVDRFGPLASSVVIELRDLTSEAFEKLPGEEREPVVWGGGEMRTRWKHCDLGSGVMVNASLIEQTDS